MAKVDFPEPDRPVNHRTPPSWPCRDARAPELTLETKAWLSLTEAGMAVGLSDGVFKARLLLMVKYNPYIRTRAVFKKLMNDISKFAGLYIGTAIFLVHFGQSSHQDLSVCVALKNQASRSANVLACRQV